MNWDPARYLAFAGPRQQPAVDLLARVALEAPEHVYDLGCGAGNVTRLLRHRWPQARIAGIDSSRVMLDRARETASNIEWHQADIGTWLPPVQADLIFSNAALHWLNDHETLFPRLLGALKPGGVLAVQMPRNHSAPSHTGMVASAEAGPWAAKLRPLLRTRPVAEPADYYDMIARFTFQFDMWETIYVHALEGEDPVVKWTSGTSLRPLLDALDESERPAFLADYARRMRDAYPERADGKTLFPFRRLFLLAVAF